MDNSDLENLDIPQEMADNEAVKAFNAGDVIMYQGEPGDAAYLIEEGEVEIYVNRPNSVSLKIGTRGPGAIIGEMAIIDNSLRTATIKAISDCKMIEITRERFQELLENADPTIKLLVHVILTRYRDTLKRTRLLKGPEGENITAEDIEKDSAAAAEALNNLKGSS